MKQKRITLLATLLLGWTAFAMAQNIKFEAVNHHFGTFAENTPVDHSFEFVNTGNSPLVIQQVISSCGCAVAQYSKQPIPPGGKGTIKVTYNGKGKFPGHFKKSITVRTNGTTAMTRLYIEGDMVEGGVPTYRNDMAKKNSAPQQTPAPVQRQLPVQVKEVPNLSIVAGSVAFSDAEGTNTVQAGKNSTIRFKVANTGKGMAYACKAKITKKGTTQGVSVSDVAIGSIKAGETKNVELPISATINTPEGQIEFAIQVDEPNGFGTDPQYLSVKTRAFEAPLVQITDYTLTADGGQVLKKKEAFDLQLMLQNVKHGQADDVVVSMELPQNVLMLDGKPNQQFAQLAGGETRSLVYSLIVNNNYEGTTIPVKVHLKERHGRFAEDRTINLSLNQELASTKLSVDARPQPKKQDVTIAMLTSDVDKDIPKSSTVQNKTFAVIIANEHYRTVEHVPYAANDGAYFEKYCRQTLGIPQQNIHAITDATFNDLKYHVEWLKQVMEAYDGEASAIFYYAGHGIPDEKNQSAYLLPTDGYAANTSTCYALDDLYAILGSIPSQQTTVFLDACFSGAKRDGSMLASARGVAIKAKASTPQGSMVVFSAAQGDETAYPYTQQQHGMFTYYLLKKIKQSGGNITLGELASYLTQEVKRQSIVINGKMQTPAVMPSFSMENRWKAMKLK